MGKEKGVGGASKLISRGGRGSRGGRYPGGGGVRGRGARTELRDLFGTGSVSCHHNQVSPLINKTGQVSSLSVDRWKRLLPGFSTYFKNPVTISEFEKKVTAVEKFLSTSTNLIKCASLFETVSSVRAFANPAYYPVDVQMIKQNKTFCNEWPTFDDELTLNPDEVIDLWSATAHKVVFDALLECDVDSDDSECPDTPCVAFIRVGFLRSSPVIPLAEIVSSSIGNFISLKGVVVRTGSLQPYISLLTFCCKICKTKFEVPQPGGSFTQPSRCESEDCSNKILFDTLEGSPTTAIVNSRIIRIQETLYSEGGVPKIVDCLLLGNLVDKCCSSDVVTLSGIVRLIPDTVYVGVQSTHNRYVEVTALELHKDIDRSMGGHMLSFTDLDYAAVNEIRAKPNLFRILVSSLCPGIYGQELVKAGLLLSLFGGRQREGFISRRSDINMLMIGDPGVGKSQMLKAISEIAPTGIYICGNGSTTAGLTVTLSREGCDYSLDAGALVLADKGVICIDELDKMVNHHHILLESMEQQSVTIAKAGIYRSLPSRVSVFAAANPTDGHYDSNKTVCENIKISPPLLSRFDLTFILLDKSDEELDRSLAQHVLGIDITRGQTNQPLVISDEGSNAHLSERLKPRKGENNDLIPHRLMRKYIAYARQYVHPALSPEAAEILKSYFLNMRRENGQIHSIPSTTRLLESLVRLTEARAKIELRELATAEDAKDVLDLFESSLKCPSRDEVQAVSVLPGFSRGTKKSGPKPEVFLTALQLYARKENRRTLDLSEMKNIGVAIGLKGNIETLIGKLNCVGDLLMKGGNKYYLMSLGS